MHFIRTINYCYTYQCLRLAKMESNMKKSNEASYLASQIKINAEQKSWK